MCSKDHLINISPWLIIDTKQTQSTVSSKSSGPSFHFLASPTSNGLPNGSALCADSDKANIPNIRKYIMQSTAETIINKRCKLQQRLVSSDFEILVVPEGKVVDTSPGLLLKSYNIRLPLRTERVPDQ